MNTSLIILIVLVVVILVAILLTSPTCKNAVANLRPESAKKAPIVNAKKDGKKVESASRQRRDQVVAKRQGKQQVAAPKSQKKTNLKASADLKNATQKASPQVKSGKSGKFVNQTDVEAKVLKEHPDAKILNSQSPFKTLSGKVENLFDPVSNEAAEFGLTEEQLDAMAKAYKKDFLDAPKVETVRHKSYVRSEVENAENKIRESFVQTTLNSVRDPSEELVSEFYKQKAMNSDEKISKKKMTFRSRK